MASDRVASLIVDAAIRKVVDFREYDFRDKRWWQHLQLLLAGIRREHRYERTALSLQRGLAVLANGNLWQHNFDDYDKAQKHVGEMLDQLNEIRYPGVIAERQQKQETTAASLRERYKLLTGIDIDSDEFQQKDRQMAAQGFQLGRRPPVE